jgi:hypothetical protein
MNLRQGTDTLIAAAAVAVTTVIAAGPANAAPIPIPPAHFHAGIDGASVVATTDDGTFTADNTAAVVDLRDARGAVTDTTPMALALDGHRYPITATISADGRTVRLTPHLPAAVKPVASPLENQLAMNDLINSASFGMSVGTLLGTVVGAVIGIGAGLAVSAAACLVISIGCVLAVVPIVTLLGATGGLAGLLLGGGGGVVAGMWNYYSTMTAAPGHSKYASQIPVFNRPGAGTGK